MRSIQFCVVGQNEKNKTLSSAKISEEVQSLTCAFPIFILVRDYFDDFTFKTTFHLRMYESKDTYNEIGVIRILDIDNKMTNLPSRFKRLDKNRFCSLGDGIDFYDRLMVLEGNELFLKVLNALNDTFIDEQLRDRYIDNDGYQKSLLRYSASKELLNESKAILMSKLLSDSFLMTKDNQIAFNFSTKLPQFSTKHSATFYFNGSVSKYDRIKILIGKNGTGKTSYLRNLALCLSGESSNRRLGKFTPEVPHIGSVIMISYSAFDSFQQPTQKNSSYVYCGLNLERGKVSHAQIIADVQNNLSNILDSKKKNIFKEILLKSEILHGNDFLLLDDLDQVSQLSSGQAILMKYLTDIVKNVQENSMILIDEIETHLHPNYMISLLRFLGEVLENFNSFCILSTHSPLVVQEIDLSRSLILHRHGKNIEIIQKDRNYIAESLGTIVDDVFNLSPRDHLYTQILNEISRKGEEDRFDFNDLASTLLNHYAKS